MLHHLLDLLADFLEHFLGLLVFHETLKIHLVEVEFLFEELDDVFELEFHVPVEVAVVAVPDWPSEFAFLRLVFLAVAFLVVQDFHVNVGVQDVVLVDEVLKVFLDFYILCCLHLNVDENLGELIAMLVHEVDKLDESFLTVESSAAFVVGCSVPDLPAVLRLLFWLF